MKKELKKVFTDIMEYQMNYVQLARTTEPYKLAEKGLKLLEECEVSGSLPIPKCKCGQNTLPYKAQIEIDKCSRCGNNL